MSVWDDRILEWISENDGSGTPKELDESGLIRVSKSQVARRLKRLAEHGLLKHVGHGAYVLTDKGEAYLNEEYDAEAERYIDEMPEASAGGTVKAEEDEANGA